MDSFFLENYVSTILPEKCCYYGSWFIYRCQRWNIDQLTSITSSNVISIIRHAELWPSRPTETDNMLIQLHDMLGAVYPKFAKWICICIWLWPPKHQLTVLNQLHLSLPCILIRLHIQNLATFTCWTPQRAYNDFVQWSELPPPPLKSFCTICCRQNIHKICIGTWSDICKISHYKKFQEFLLPTLLNMEYKLRKLSDIFHKSYTFTAFHNTQCTIVYCLKIFWEFLYFVFIGQFIIHSHYYSKSPTKSFTTSFRNRKKWIAFKL